MKKQKEKIVTRIIALVLIFNMLSVNAFAMEKTSKTISGKSSMLAETAKSITKEGKFTAEFYDSQGIAKFKEAYDKIKPNGQEIFSKNIKILKDEIKKERKWLNDESVKRKNHIIKEVKDSITFCDENTLKTIDELLNEYEVELENQYVGPYRNISTKLFDIKQQLSVYAVVFILSDSCDNDTCKLFNDALKDFLLADSVLCRTAIGDAKSILSGNTCSFEDKLFLTLIESKFNFVSCSLENDYILIPTVLYNNIYNDCLKLMKSFGFEYKKGISNKDTDQDGLDDSIEILIGANPNKSDTDKDGLTDNDEYKLFPFCLPDKADTDGNGILDKDEDIDKDGLINSDELKAGTDPLTPDSDKDGLDDKVEVKEFNSNPLKIDTDEDGLTDKQEYLLKTNPNVKDSNEDGKIDSEEEYTIFIPEKDGLSAEIIGKGNVIDSTTITKVDLTNGKVMPGQLSDSIDISTDGKFTEAEVRIKLNSDDLKNIDPKDIRIMYFDETDKVMKLCEGEQGVDVEKGYAWARVNHFTTFAVFNIVNWNQQWTAYKGSGRLGDDDSGEQKISYIDCAIVLDSSGSMTSSDRQGYRKTSAKSFINALLDKDRISVIDFDDSVRICQDLTVDKNAAKNAVDTIDSSGGTNIAYGIRTANQILIKNSDEERGKICILLTDGDGYYDNSLTKQAKDNNINIYTIGLGNGVNESLLKNIADETGGKYYHIVNAEDLPHIFNRIGQDTGVDDTDTDGDGLSDFVETNGIRDGVGNIYYTDPKEPDTDGDGLEDGVEVGIRPYINFEDDVFYSFTKAGIVPDEDDEDIPTYNNGYYFKLRSAPDDQDGDNDGIEDENEYINGSNPLAKDSDKDKHYDLNELKDSTDPLSKDTDKDGFTDYEEANDNGEHGLDPLKYDEKVSKWRYAAQYVKGFICGDALDDSDIPYLLGAITSGIVPFVDIAADSRDVIFSAFKGDWGSVCLNVAGFIPVAGDGAQVVGKTGKFVLKHLDKADEICAMIAKLTKLSKGIRLKAIKKALEVSGAYLTIQNLLGDSEENSNAQPSLYKSISYNLASLSGKKLKTAEEIALELSEDSVDATKLAKKITGRMDKVYEFTKKFPEMKQFITDNLQGVKLSKMITCDFKRILTDDSYAKIMANHFKGALAESKCKEYVENAVAGAKELLNKEHVTAKGLDQLYEMPSGAYRAVECKSMDSVLEAGKLKKYMKIKDGNLIFDSKFLLNDKSLDDDTLKSIEKSIREGNFEMQVFSYTEGGGNIAETLMNFLNDGQKEIEQGVESISKEFTIKIGKDDFPVKFILTKVDSTIYK